MIVLDVEASGTEAHKHSIVSLGALDFMNPTNRFYEECRVWEGAHIMDEALVVNGFTKEQIHQALRESGWSDDKSLTFMNTFHGKNL